MILGGFNLFCIFLCFSWAVRCINRLDMARPRCGRLQCVQIFLVAFWAPAHALIQLAILVQAVAER